MCGDLYRTVVSNAAGGLTYDALSETSHYSDDKIFDLNKVAHSTLTASILGAGGELPLIFSNYFAGMVTDIAKIQKAFINTIGNLSIGILSR